LRDALARPASSLSGPCGAGLGLVDLRLLLALARFGALALGVAIGIDGNLLASALTRSIGRAARVENDRSPHRPG